ncbi:hypothetical protein, partial [Kitasatospora purpeofusca]
MKPNREDQGLWDFYEHVVKRTDLDGASQATMMEVWNAERQRQHERKQLLHQRFDSMLAYVAMATVLGVAYLLAKDGDTAKTWLAAALIPPAVVLVGKFLNRPVTQLEANMVSAGTNGAFGAFRRTLGASPPQPAAAAGPPAPPVDVVS